MHIGRYELIEELGSGGMGTVSVACERTPGGGDRLVALKLIRGGLASEERLVRLMTQEASIVARLSHRNIVRIHRLGEQDGQYFIAMELVEGATLQELIASVPAHGPLDLGACACATMQACRGAHAAHELSLVHRDISPHNVIVDVAGTAKLLDFGIATETTRSATGTSVWGKSSYVSPEQATGAPLDARSDVYALGTLFWELLAGQRRIAREDDRANILAIMGGDAPSLWPLRPQAPRSFVDVVERALAVRRDDRFASAADMADAIEAAARAERIDVSEAVLARVVDERVGGVVAARRQRVLGIERTLRITIAASGGRPDDATVVEDRERTAVSPTSDTALPARPRAVPLDDDGAHTTMAGGALPVVAAGPNYEVRSDARVLICRVWARPDLSRDEGAQAGKELMTLMLDAFTRPALRAVVIDARQARMVIGGRTLEAIERMFQGAEQRSITIVALISDDPIQRLDFTDVVARAAPRHGRVSVDADEALRIVGLR